MKVHLKDSKQLGNDIRLYRIRSRISQSDLAKELNVSPQAISNWERGETYMSLDIIVRLSKLMGISLDDFLLYDVHGDYSYYSIFDRIRLREFWIDLYDIQQNPQKGEIVIDLRLQYNQYTLFVEDMFSVQLFNNKNQEIPFLNHGWINEAGVNESPSNEDVIRQYRLSFRKIHQPFVLMIRYNSSIKQIELNPEYMDCITKATCQSNDLISDPTLQQKLIDFYMKSNKVDQLMKFMNSL